MDSIKPLYDAIQVHRNNYDSGDTDYSVTTLLNPPRIVHLEKRHLNKVDMFVREQLGSWIGTGLHNYLEANLNAIPNSPYKCEERLFIEILDRKVSGSYDVVHTDGNNDEDMYDLKTTSTWKVVFGDKHDWTAQQNMYRWLYHHHKKKTIKTLRIIGIFLDWSLRNKQASHSSKFPAEKAVEYSLERWSFAKTYDYMLERVAAMKEHENTPDDDLPLCTFEEMWSRPDQFAVKAIGRKKALRVCSSRDEARQWTKMYLNKPTCKHKLSQISLEVRQAVRTRCEMGWCPVAPFCNQYQEHLKTLALDPIVYGTKPEEA